MNFFTLDKSVFSFIKESDRRKSAVSFNNKYILEIRRISKFDTLLCKAAVNFDEFFEVYKTRYDVIKRQKEEALKEDVISFEKYTLKPNSMQEEFITNLREIIESGEERALLISATGTGKTYASAFAMRVSSFPRAVFPIITK